MNMARIFRVLRTAQILIENRAGDYADIMASQFVTPSEGFELAKYILNVGEVRSWTGKLILHTGMRRNDNEPFALSTAFVKLVNTIDLVEINLVLSDGEKLGLAKFFLGNYEEVVVDSKVILRTNFKRNCGDANVSVAESTT